VAVEGAQFYPVVFETLGRMGKQTRAFFKRVAKFAGSNATCERRHFLRSMLSSLSVCLQRSNAHAYLFAALKVRDRPVVAADPEVVLEDADLG